MVKIKINVIKSKLVYIDTQVYFSYINNMSKLPGKGNQLDQGLGDDNNIIRQ